jgi:hypothetical protein
MREEEALLHEAHEGIETVDQSRMKRLTVELPAREGKMYG